MDKPELIQTFRGLLQERLQSVEGSLADARGSMRVDADFCPQNRCERAAVTSQGYLATGLGRRSTEIKLALELLDQVDPGPRELVSPGALVRVDDGDQERRYLLLPGGQGDRLETPEGPVLVISPGSPVARALKGLPEGEVGRLKLQNEFTELEVVEVR